MPIVSIGDMSQHFMSLKSGGAIKSDLARLGQELSTGKVADITAHLGGDTRQFSGIVHSLSVLDAYKVAAKETATTLDQMQIVLSRVDDSRSDAAGKLLMISGDSQPELVEQAGEIARLAFSDIVNTLNGQLAGRSLLGGSNVDAAPLAAPDAMLNDLLAGIGGVTTITAVELAVEAWFDDPAGGFATFAYQGDDGEMPSRRIAEDLKIDMDVRADDPAIKELLKSVALGAIMTELGSSLSTRDRGVLLQKASIGMLESSASIIALEAKVGNLQSLVSTGLTRLEAERTSLSIAQNGFEAADPFETATRLEAVQTQLEIHFTVTSRLSQLSLVEYI